MLGLVTVATIYVFGGLTFLPLCIAAFCAFLFYTSPVVDLPPGNTAKATRNTSDDDEAEPISVYRAGWLAARRTYEPSKDNGDGTYVGMLTSSYKSFMDNRSKDPRRSRPKDRFYAVLKQKTLYLYEGEDQTECWAAIDVTAHQVVLFPEKYLDGELFAKRTAIELRPKAESAVDSLLDSEKAAEENELRIPPWYLFVRVNSDKEDWYHSLMLASRLGSPSAAGDVARDRSLFDPEDMARLVESIDQQPESIPMRWLNAILGRIFLAVYRTKSVEDYITSRIVRKLKRVKLPTMLSEIQVREVHVGASVPLFSKPMLKELTAEGDASMETHVAYVGNARVTIETEATISLGSRFKPYTVRLVLAIVLKELEGTMLFKVKKPPSNRLWFGFTTMPKMVLAVEPVVSTRQIKWSLVTGPIESRIRELVSLMLSASESVSPADRTAGLLQMMEALVLPHMDDLAFFNTSAFPFARGGIYGDFLRNPEPTREEELNAPKREDREATSEEVPEEELVGEEAASSAVSPQKADKEGLRPTAASRRRRSSDEDHSAPTRTPEALEGTPGKGKKTDASTSSVSSLAGIGATLSQWRENAKSGSTSTSGSSTKSKNRGDATPQPRKSTWFGSSSKAGANSVPSGPASASAPNLITRTPSTLSVASTETGSSVPAAEERGREEVSAARLRDILSKRAESRERERRRQREIERTRELEADAAIARAGRVDSPSLARTANADIGSLDDASSAPPAVEGPAEHDETPAPSDAAQLTPLASGPVPSRDTDTVSLASVTSSVRSNGTLSSVEETAQLHVPPALPARPSWTKRGSAETASIKSTKTPPSDGTPLPSPLPGHPRHAASASVDGTSGSPSGGSSTLLANWRSRAGDKEALAAGVASAKESMRRWGANWAAKRSAKEAARVDDFDNVVGESPEKPRDSSSADRYREHRRERERSGAAGGYFGGVEADASQPIPMRPKTPPNVRAGSSEMADASNPATSPSRTSSDFAPASRSAPTQAASPPTSPSSSPRKPSMMPSIGSMPHAGGYGSSSAAMSGYGRRTMAVPGIRGEDRKKRVAEDHMGSGVAPAAGKTSPSGAAPEAPSGASASPPADTVAPSAKAEEPEQVPSTASDAATAENEDAALTALGVPKTSSPEPSDPNPLVSLSPPPLPTRSTATEDGPDSPPAPAVPERAAPPPLPARAPQSAPAESSTETTSAEPPIPPKQPPALPARRASPEPEGATAEPDAADRTARSTEALVGEDLL